MTIEQKKQHRKNTQEIAGAEFRELTNYKANYISFTPFLLVVLDTEDLSQEQCTKSTQHRK